MSIGLCALRDDSRLRGLVHAYLMAKQHVVASGFEAEITWQEEARPTAVTGQVFVREAAWVILCSGMRESVVRRHFPYLGKAFEGWEPRGIALRPAACRREALAIFDHPRKLDAIIRIAIDVRQRGVGPILEQIGSDGPISLTRLPYIGEVTCYHLAKNLGYPVAKPDRHLQRVAAAWGFDAAAGLCGEIADFLDEPVQVVDLVMWRYATIDRHYLSSLEVFAEHGRACGGQGTRTHDSRHSVEDLPPAGRLFEAS